MTRQELEEIMIIDKRINSKIRQKERLENLACYGSPQGFEQERVQSSPKDRADMIVKAVDLEREIISEIDKLIGLKAEAINIFRTLLPKERQLMEYRYLEGMKWEDVSVAMGYRDPRRAFQVHDEVLRKLF